MMGLGSFIKSFVGWPNADATTTIKTADYLAMKLEVEKFREMLSMGVGDGSGRLFVHGDQRSIMRCQEIILEWEKLKKYRTEAEIQKEEILKDLEQLKLRLDTLKADVEAKKSISQIKDAYDEAVVQVMKEAWESLPDPLKNPFKILFTMLGEAMLKELNGSAPIDVEFVDGEGGTPAAPVNAATGKVLLRFNYFKESGKWKYSGECECEPDDDMIYPSCWGKKLRRECKLPGLQSGTWGGPFTVEVVGSYTELVPGTDQSWDPPEEA